MSHFFAHSKKSNCATVLVINRGVTGRKYGNKKNLLYIFWESSRSSLSIWSELPYGVFCLLSGSPNQRNQNKQKYLVCISNTASPTPLLTDALWNKEGTLLTAPGPTANHVRVVPASWPITCLSCSGLPPLLLLMKVPMVVDKLQRRGEERRGQGFIKGDSEKNCGSIYSQGENWTAVETFSIRKEWQAERETRIALTHSLLDHEFVVFKGVFMSFAMV